MHFSRIIDANVIDFIKRDILTNELGDVSKTFYNFVVEVKGHRLKFNESDPFNKEGVTAKTKKDSKRVWESSAIEFVHWQANSDVVVKNKGAIVPKTKYAVDFQRGRILFGKIFGRQLKGNEIITADFKKPIISTIPAYSKKIESINLPFMVIESPTNRNQPFELGGQPERVLEYELDIFARNNGELKEFEGILLEKLEFGIKYILDFNKGQPLKELGAINKSFKYSDIITEDTIRFEDVLSTKIRIPDASKLEEFWSRITFSAVARTEILQAL